MGSRAVVIVCRDDDAARRRFGVTGQGIGIVYTRTGRRFFPDHDTERALLDRLAAALTATGLWEEFNTDWFCIDAELLPWSAKALELVKSQYAAVGAAARTGLRDAVAALAHRRRADPRRRATLDARGTATASRGRSAYVDAYRHYCWPVESLADLKLAPFHLLASACGVHVDRDHSWHMETLARVCAAEPEILLATPYRVIDLGDQASQDAALAWWIELTSRGGEGMVVKPLDFVARDQRGVVQPAAQDPRT